MFYAILAYHVEDAIKALTPQEDAALMADLLKINTRLHEEGTLGPSARLGATQDACTLRGPGDGVIIDGPFAETKEQLLGLYIVDCATRDAAIAIARDLRRVNPTAVYEIRPVMLFKPGVPLAGKWGGGDSPARVRCSPTPDKRHLGRHHRHEQHIGVER